MAALTVTVSVVFAEDIEDAGVDLVDRDEASDDNDADDDGCGWKGRTRKCAHSGLAALRIWCQRPLAGESITMISGNNDFGLSQQSRPSLHRQ